MNEKEDARALQRFIALDINKHYCVIAGGPGMPGDDSASARGTCRLGRVAEEEPAEHRLCGDRIDKDIYDLL